MLLTSAEIFEASSTNSVDPDHTAPVGLFRSEYTLSASIPGPPGVLGIWGEWLIIFRELGSTGNYFRGAREQAHNFGDLGNLAKGKASIFVSFTNSFSFGGGGASS